MPVAPGPRRMPGSPGLTEDLTNHANERAVKFTDRIRGSVGDVVMGWKD